METARVGIIGGTGLYDIEGLSTRKKILPDTPWGKPSDEISLVEYKTKSGDVLSLAFLARHGRGHYILPSQIPQKANLATFKILGVEYIIAFSAVGSLRKEIKPTHFVLPNQIIDRTRNREDTFYGDGIVVHINFGHPFSQELSSLLEEPIHELGITLHKEKTLIAMEGPAFSTQAESKIYRSWGGDIINMSALPEAKLARELEISYQMVCMSTDYDSWRETSATVTAEEIMQVVGKNSELGNKILKQSLERLAVLSKNDSPLKGNIKNSIITSPDKRPQKTREKLNLLMPGYF